MTSKPTAIGYLRRDVSGISQMWDETQVRSAAKRLGYNLAKTIVFSSRTDNPISQLIANIRHIGAEVVITPGPAHFGGGVPDELVRVCDVVTVSPEATYARWALPSMGADGA